MTFRDIRCKDCGAEFEVRMTLIVFKAYKRGDLVVQCPECNDFNTESYIAKGSGKTIPRVLTK